ncbi:hypothetical protein DFH28DRAFT_938524 [Melampsora americana]|nr:hypothetical protein DFH28DRAFT_938524 [Melampsora americana]
MFKIGDPYTSQHYTSQGMHDIGCNISNFSYYHGSQVLTGAMQLAQSSGVSKKNKSTKTKMPRQSKRKTTTPAKPRSPRKARGKPRKTQSKKTKKSQTKSEGSQEPDSKDKTTIHWDQDDNGEGKNSMYLLLNWLTDENNFTRFKDNKTEKRTVAEEIERYLIENGILWRDQNAIRKKIARLELAWRKADQEHNRTGAGSWKTAQEQKACSGWGDEDPEWLSIEKAALVPILKLCKYYFELKPVFATRHGNVRLAVSQSLPPSTEDNEIKVQSQRDAREHSVNSNLAVERGHEVTEQDQIDSSDPTMDDVRNLVNDNDSYLQDFEDTNPPKTPLNQSISSQHQSQYSQSSTYLKRTASAVALDLSSRSSSSKRGRPTGSASSIHGLFQERNYGSTPAPADNIDNEAFQRHSQKLDRLSQIAENSKLKKSKIEIELAEVKLDSEKFNLDARKEKHVLETRQLQAELEHQQIARNANLISSLMKEHNLSIQDAMLMAQHAQMLLTSSSSSSK